MKLKALNHRYILIQTLLSILIILTIGFIFSNSMLDRTASAEQSQRITALIEPILKLFVGTVTDAFVRNLAHMAELSGSWIMVTCNIIQELDLFEINTNFCPILGLFSSKHTILVQHVWTSFLEKDYLRPNFGRFSLKMPIIVQSLDTFLQNTQFLSDCLDIFLVKRLFTPKLWTFFFKNVNFCPTLGLF